jgi:uncharacterized membrane protein YfcA
MTARDRVRGLLAGAAAGTAGGLFGVGGGLLLVPILTGRFRLSQHAAHGTSLAVIGATALVAVVVYGAHGNVAWTTAAIAAIGSLAGAPLGARWATRVSARGLTRSFAVFLALVALRLFWEAPDPSAPLPMSPAATIGFDLALGFATGVLAGFMGIGGGALVVPACTLVFGMTQQTAQGTSLAMILVTAPAGAIEHSRNGNVVWALVPTLAVGAALGAPTSAWLAQILPHEWLVRAFATFLLVMSVQTWRRAGRTPARPETGSVPPSR